MSQSTQQFGALSGPFQPSSQEKASALVIFLHGYGANGQDLFGLGEPLLSALGRDDIAIWSPNAPDPLPGMDGPFSPMEAYQWFPIDQIDRSKMAKDVQVVRPKVQEAIIAAAQALGLPLSSVVVVGFSQGGMVAMETCLWMAEEVAAIVGLSTAYLGEGREAEIKSKPPITLVHGDADAVVPPDTLKASVQALLKAGFDPEAFMVPGLQHGIDANAFEILVNATAAALEEDYDSD